MKLSSFSGRRTRIAHVPWLILCGVFCAAILPTASFAAEPRPLRIATTTSVANTKLLDYLTEVFRKDAGIEIQYVAVGTGKALKHGENGDVDVVLVHAPEAEMDFVRQGFGVERMPIMWNDFVIVGPAGDPADIAGSESAAEAFRRIQVDAAPFISRGDDSGTHKKEQEIWKAAGIQPAGTWYVEAGQGMDACLIMGSEKAAYVLTDRGTFLSMGDKLQLALLYDGDPLLLNPYSVIEVSPSRFPDLNHAGAKQFIAWITSPKVQQLIAAYQVNGQKLFHPAAEKPVLRGAPQEPAVK